LHVQGAAAAFAALETAIQAARRAAGVSGPPLAACLGLAGVDRPNEFELVSAWWNGLFPSARLQMVNDAWLALAAGTPDGVGAAIICGTGSIAVARSSDGRTARSGGWGYLFGDEGSGYAIGLQALQVVSQAADGRSLPTLLTNLLLAHFGVPNPSGLIGEVYSLPSPRAPLARLAIHVQTAADQGDPAALTILNQAGHDLAAATAAATRQVDLNGPTPIGAAGGVLTHWPALQEAFRQSAARLGLEATPFTIVPVPAIGAVRLALKMLA
jgi:N-acetylglucosamine kinase-like BadF-type ATPase